MMPPDGCCCDGSPGTGAPCAVPPCAFAAPMIAIGLPFHAESPTGRLAQSIAFFRTPLIEKLYSGLAINRPSAAAISARSASI